MTPAEMALHAVVIRSLRTVANAWEKWLEEQKLVDRVPPRLNGVADSESGAPDTRVASPVERRRA